MSAKISSSKDKVDDTKSDDFIINPINLHAFIRFVVLAYLIEFVCIKAIQNLFSPGIFVDATLFTIYLMYANLLMSMFGYIISIYIYTINQISIWNSIFMIIGQIALIILIVINYKLVCDYPGRQRWTNVSPLLSAAVIICFNMGKIYQIKKEKNNNNNNNNDDDQEEEIV